MTHRELEASFGGVKLPRFITSVDGRRIRFGAATYADFKNYMEGLQRRIERRERLERRRRHANS